MKNLIVNLLDILPDCMHAELLSGMQKIDEIDDFLKSSSQTFAQEGDELFDYFLSKQIEG